MPSPPFAALAQALQILLPVEGQSYLVCVSARCARACRGAWTANQGDHAAPHGSGRADPLGSLQRDEVLAARYCGCKCSAPRRARAAPPAREVQAILACSSPKTVPTRSFVAPRHFTTC